MTNTDLIAPTQDEKVMAALSHVSAIVPMMGLFAPILIWVTQRGKSKFVAFQSLQALAYQLVMIAAWFVGMGCYVLSFFGTFLFIPLFSSSGNSDSANLFTGMMYLIPFLFIGVVLLVGFGFIVYAVVGAVLTFQGKPFRYVLLGKMIERFLQESPAASAPKSTSA